MPKTRFSTELIGEFALTAGANDETSAEKRARVATQLRDRYGRWVEMGRGVKFKVRLPNGQYHNVLGPFTGDMTPDGRGYIKVENDPYLPNGDYPVASDNAQQYVALLSDEELKDLGIELGKNVDGNTVTAREDSSIPDLADLIAEGIVSGSPNKELRSSITGDEIQDMKMSSIAKALKAEGRFPVPRQSSLDTWGKNSDLTKGAKLDYAKVYEGMGSENPEFAENYPTFDSFWKRVVNLAVDDRDQSPNDLNSILPEMKEINKGYAKHVLGLDPENGTFTVYRNAINNSLTEKDAAVGYVTTNANFAWDYNSKTRVGEFSNGRYEITVKPDEVFGMIGYSQVEDEYGLTIGRGVTYQEGRVKKVGELETPPVAPWHEEAVGKLKRGQGATPFRGHSFVGQFDFLPISKNPLQGDSLQDFLDDNSITMDDWKNKFDELHGEGAYQRFKDSGRENQVSLQSLQRMFVDLGDGTYGLDITKLSPSGNDSAGGASYGDVQNPSSFLNDYVDNKLKFLSLIQEITGEPYMVHKNNPRAEEFEQPEPVQESAPAPAPEPEPDTKINVSELPEGSLGDGIKREPRSPGRAFDEVKFDIKEEFNGDEEYAVYEYQGSLYESTNKFARENPNYKLGDKPRPKDGGVYLDSALNTVDNLDSAFKKSYIAQDLTVYRGAYVSNRNYEQILEIKEGDYINDSAYLSTSANPEIAKKFAKLLPGYDSPGEVDEDGTFIPDTDRMPVLYKINLKSGQPAMRVKDHTGQNDFLDEEEILLPRNSKIKVTGLSKSTQTVGGLNMEVLLIEAEYETKTTKEPQPESEKQGESSGFVLNPPPWSEEDARNYGRDRNPRWHIDSNGYEYTPTDYGTYVSILVWSPEAGEYVGKLDFRKVDGEIMQVDVEEEHRRKGIATNSLGVARAYAEESGLPPVTHSNDRTPEGEAWAKSIGDELPTNIKDIPEEYEKWKNLADYLNSPDPTPIVTDGTSTITDRKGNTINPGEEVDISYSIYEVGKGSRNAEKPLKAIFTGYKESDFSAGKGIETKNRAILYVPEQEGTLAGYYGVSPYVLNADPNSDDFRGVGGTSPVNIDGFSEKNALPSPKQMTPLSEQEAESVIDYTNHKGSYVEINSSLRNDSVSEEIQEKIDVLDKIIGYNQILEDQDYYRGIPIPLGLTLKEFLTSLDSGEITELNESGFSSTSTDEQMASIFANKYFGGGVVLRIKAKAGQSAYYVPKFLAGVIANENEVILPRGIKYRIVSHEFDPQEDKVLLNVEIG
jgi:GNAT superfamily N-acetyltransferase